METVREKRPVENRKLGLLAQGRNGETHLYHPTKPPVVSYTPQMEAQLRADGYGDEYIHQEYPKAVKVGEDANGDAVMRAAHNHEHEKEIKKGKPEKHADPAMMPAVDGAPPTATALVNLDDPAAGADGYPKEINIGKDDEGNIVSRTVHSAAEEAAVRAKTADVRGIDQETKKRGAHKPKDKEVIQMLAIAPTGQQTMSQAEIDRFLTEARMAPTTKAPRVLGINQIPLMRAKNNGYPVDMYHPEHEMRQALKEEEEEALTALGYQRQPIAKDYPKALFRRNMAAQFEPRFDLATGIQISHAFVEERVVRNSAQEKELRAMKPRAGQSAWFEKLTEIPEIEELPEDNSDAVKIARLQGQLDAHHQAHLPGQAGRQRRR